MLFNRPDLTAGLFECLRGRTTGRVYIAIDGPRGSHPEDARRCAEVREVVAAQTWLTDKVLLAQDDNLGCGPGVRQALDWFFAHEEEGVILEDDCHPSPDFFDFVPAMLRRYRQQEDIFMVTGSSFLPYRPAGRGTHFLSKYTQIWGWGTWRDRWSRYHFTFPAEARDSWRQTIRTASASEAEAYYWLREFERLCDRAVPHTWDYQLQFSCWRAGARCVWPVENLVTNHGLRGDATHTRDFNAHLQREAGSLAQGADHPEPPAYEPVLDQVLFWFHFLEGDVQRFRYLLFESDAAIQEKLGEIARLGDLYENHRLAQEPMLKDILPQMRKWWRRNFGRR